MKVLNAILEKFGPYQRRKDLRSLVTMCQIRIKTLETLRTSSTNQQFIDNSNLEKLHKQLLKQRLLAEHNVRVNSIISEAIPES